MDSKHFFSTLKQDLKDLVSLDSHIDTEAAIENIKSGIPFRGPNVLVLFFAIMVASLGLNVNSIPVIIGAMLISPLMGPIIGFGLALGINDTKLLWHSLKQLVVMVIISILGATLYFILTPLHYAQPSELLARTNPTIYDVLIALFGGLAAILEISRKDKGTVMSGVAIATALMPPLCTVGYGISQLNLHYAVGALYLFFINSVFIAFATFVMVKFLNYPVTHEADQRRERNRTILIWFVLILIMIPSIISAITIIRTNNIESRAVGLVTNNKSIGKSYVYDYKISTGKQPQIDIWIAGEKLSSEEREDFYLNAEQAGFWRSQIIFHEDAVTDFTPFNQESFVKDVFANHEQQLKERDERIKELEDKIKAYELAKQREVQPTTQLSKEIQTQYPIVAGITLAQGENCVDSLHHETVVVLHYAVPEGKKTTKKPSLSDKEKEQLRQWLIVRMQTEDIIVL